jgi:hypothetical protein
MVAHRLRNLAGSAAVLSALLVVVFGLPALNRAMPVDRAVVGDERYEVSQAVTVLPPAGARIDVSKTRPSADRGTVLFLVGPVRYVIVVTEYSGEIREAAAKLRSKIQATRGYQITAGEDAIATSSGLTGLAGGYTAPGRCGRYAVFLIDDVSIEVSVSGAELELQHALSAIERSIASITYSDD